jgi:glutamine synthetase
MTPGTVGDAVRRLEEARAAHVHLQFVDLFGTVNSVNIPAARFADVCAHGAWFDGSAVEGFARVLESDMYLIPDPSTMTEVPWEARDGSAGVMRVLCAIRNPDGDPFPGDTRALLAEQLRRASGRGFEYHVGAEVELFLFASDVEGRPLPSDRAGYFDETMDAGSMVREELVRTLGQLGVSVESSHHEVAPGQHEVDIAFEGALAVADAVILLHLVARAVAQTKGLRASFMPKPLRAVSGSGLHIHQGLLRPGDGANLFFDAADRYRLSPLARHFIAGQLAHAGALTALTAPTVNSYKRLVPGYEAPTEVTWAHSNRSALIRVPRVSAAEAGISRVELRCPDAACNPYLALAAMLAAGLDGIDRELPLGPPLEEAGLGLDPEATERRYVRALPGSLHEAVAALSEDDTLVDALGGDLVSRFAEAKRIEWQEFASHVTDWEVARYL